MANPINRYLVNSPMLPQLQKDADGDLPLIVQNQSPGKERKPTGCPHPRSHSPSSCAYWPKEAALDGKWTPPPLKRAT